MKVLMLIAGGLLICLGAACLFIAIRMFAKLRSNLRYHTGETLALLPAQWMLLGGYFIVLLAGIGLVWFSRA